MEHADQKEDDWWLISFLTTRLFVSEWGGPSVQAVVKVGDTVSDIREGKNAGVRSLGVLEGSSVMGMTQAAYEALSAEKKQAALDRARQVFLEAGADDVLLNIEQLPAWIQAND